MLNGNSLENNPGLIHITRKILMCLDTKTLKKCRFVSHSWKFHVDQPLLWIKKLNQKGQPKELYDAWIDLYQNIEEESSLYQDMALCTMKFCQRLHRWTISNIENGITPYLIAARYGVTSIVQYMASTLENPNQSLPDGRTPRHGPL